MILTYFILSLLFNKSFGTIYHLNDTEYKKLPPLFELDDYETCVETPDWIYCVANLEIYTVSQNKIYTLIQEYSKHSSKHYNYSKIDRGVCVTKTCQSYASISNLDVKRDLKLLLEGCLNESMQTKYNLMTRIYNMNCNKQTDDVGIYIDVYDCIFLVTFIVFIVLAMMGSYYDFYLRELKTVHIHTKGERLLLCFSVLQNLKKLITVEEADPRMNRFKGFHSVRTISTMFIVLAHTLLIAASFTVNPHNFEKSYEYLIIRMLNSASIVVQIFFFMSGFLLTYFLQISSEKSNVTWKNIPFIILQRWLRLMPSAAVIVAFTATWMRHLSHGPLWNMYISNGATEQCRRYFWAHIFLYNNYLPEDTLCAFQTWHIATDMQLFILGLFVHFFIRNRSSNFKIVTLTSLLMVGIVLPAIHVWWQDHNALFMQNPEMYRSFGDPTFRKFHIAGHNNLSCFIIGMGTGYWIYYMQRNRVAYSNYKVANFLGWCVIFAMVVYCGNLFYYDGERPSLPLRMLYAATNRTILGIGNIFLITSVTYEFNALIRWLIRPVMEWHGWTVLSKLSYSVYLLHVVFIFIILGVRTQLTPVSFVNTFFMFVGIVTVSFVTAVPYYLLIEAPINKLTKALVTDNIKKRN